MTDDTDPPDYTVGYGKPPLATRFQAGQSGNPRGRPKGSLNVATQVQKAMSEKVVVNINGRRKSMSKMDAAFTQQANRAAAGDPKSTKLMMDLLNGSEDREEAKAARTPVSADSRKARHDLVLAALKVRFNQGDDDGSAG